MTYPAHLESDVVLRDGSTVSLRPVRPEDGPLLLDFFKSLDERSLAFRFFTGAPDLDAVAEILADVDYRRRFGLLALRGEERRPVAHGFFAAIDDEVVEVAFAVRRELQGQGLGSVLLAQLAERAAEDGYTRMVADVMPENHKMVSMFRHSGLPIEVRAEPDSVVVEMPTSPDPEAIARFQERDAAAARAAVAALFDPETVAPIDGAPGTVLLRVRELARDGGRAVVVRGEPGAWGTPGSAAELELLDVCRHGGMRLVGPGSFGILDNRPERRLNLTAAAELPPFGPIGIVAQSAPAGRELLAEAARRGIGVSSFVSLGDRADISANDLLEYWEEEPATEVALLQVESYSDPRRFARVARRVGAAMPIVVVAAGAAAEAPGRDLFDQVGAVRVGSIPEGLEVAAQLVGRRDGEGTSRALPVPVSVPGARPDEAAAILAVALARGAAELDPETCAALIDCYGVAVGARARDRDGGDPTDVVAHAAEAPPAETLLRVDIAADPFFGPVLHCGSEGGPEDRPVRLCPLAAGDAAALSGTGIGGAPLSPAGRESLERVLEAVAALAAEHAEVATVELDPLVVSADGGAVARHARVSVRRPPERRPWPRTWE